jgi:hypothetical protein
MQNNKLINLSSVRMNEREREEIERLFAEWKDNLLPPGFRGNQSDFIRFKLLQPNPEPARQEA